MEKRRKRKMRGWIGKIGAFANIATALILVCSANRIAPAYGAADGKPIAGIQCERQEYGNFHIHAHLDIFIDGKPHAVPESIGIINRKCLYWMHTHDPSGIIHIEAPQTRAFTLAQFFEIWKSTAKGVPATKEAPKIYVNGMRVNGRLEQVEIGPLAEIALVYGKEPATVPSSYDFSKGL
jgi:hypothetical protein